jgi:PAS domain-containing protein
MIGTVRDLTAETIRSLKLEESENRFRKRIAQPPIPMVVLRGPEHTMEIVNAAMIARWKKPESYLVGKPIAQAFSELPDQHFIKLLDHVYATGQPHHETESASYLLDENGKRTFYVDFNYVSSPSPMAQYPSS